MPGENTLWTAGETEALVEAYIDLARRIGRGENVNKQQVYRELAGRFGRSVRICERKLCSFSCVVADLRLPWIPGLPPLRKLGVATTEIIGQMLLVRGYEAVAATLPAPGGGRAGLTDSVVE